MGNITGAMVFQSCIPTVVGLVLASEAWSIHEGSYTAFFSAGIALPRVGRDLPPDGAARWPARPAPAGRWRVLPGLPDPRDRGRERRTPPADPRAEIGDGRGRRVPVQIGHGDGAPNLCTVQVTVCPLTSPSRHRSVRPSASTRRPGLRTVVVAPAVAVIVGMAIVVSNSVADELRRSATESAVHNVEAIVRGYVDPGAAGVEPRPRRAARPGDRRAARTADPVGRDPPDQHLVARRPDRVFERRRSCAAGASRSARRSRAPTPATASPATSGRRDRPTTAARCRSTSLPPLSGRYLELFVPIRGAVDGNPIGVYDVYQDARLIEQRIDATRSGVFVVALVASSLLVALIWLAFGGASRVLAGQNRRLQEQATTERLLLVDLQRSEERFRSLVQNASDGVVVLGEDGLIRYESPAVERILGRRAEDGDRPAGDRGRPPGRPRDRGASAGRCRRLERLGGRRSSSGPATPTARGGRSRRSPRTCSTTRPSAASSSTTATSPSARRSRSSSATRRSTTS